MNTYAFLVVWAAVVLLLVPHARTINDVRKRDRRLRRLGIRLDRLVKNAGVEFDPYAVLPSQVVDALRRGEKTKAIKLYRSATGVSLKEAEDFIDDVQRRTRG